MIVASQSLIDELAEYPEEISVGQCGDIELRPGGALQSRAKAASVRRLESGEPRERLDQAGAQSAIEMSIVDADVMGQLADLDGVAQQMDSDGCLTGMFREQNL
jgi:hypothetical protein